MAGLGFCGAEATRVAGGGGGGGGGVSAVADDGAVSAAADDGVCAAGAAVCETQPVTSTPINNHRVDMVGTLTNAFGRGQPWRIDVAGEVSLENTPWMPSKVLRIDFGFAARRSLETSANVCPAPWDFRERLATRPGI
jgi:hypothetical protein